jgi:hypothetical protein
MHARRHESEMGGPGVQHAEHCRRAEFQVEFLYSSRANRRKAISRHWRLVPKPIWFPIWFLDWPVARSMAFSLRWAFDTAPYSSSCRIARALPCNLYYAPIRITVTNLSSRPRLAREELSSLPDPAGNRQVGVPAGC